MDHLTLESKCYNQIKAFKLILRRKEKMSRCHSQ